jgi:hypothetical protein
MRKKSSHLNAFVLLLILSAGMMSMAAQEVSIKGSVINPSQHPVGNVKVYLKSNPSIYCYSDSNGLFQLSSSPTSVTALKFNERISVNPDGSLQIHALQNSLSIDIYDMLGRRVKEVIHRENLNGIYRIHPGAYLNDLPGAIYIARVRVDEYSKGIKVSNLRAVDIPTGLTRIADYTEPPEQVLKSDEAEDDTLVFSSDFYRPASLAISSYSGDVGVIQLENFGDYTVAEGMDPDKIQINPEYGSFLQLISENDIEFEINFDSASCYERNLIVKAIPISQLDFLPDNLEFISGIHLEPSGTQFLNPLQVIVKFNKPVSDSLVVFGYSDENEIYYLPFISLGYIDNPYLIFYISHFSGVGVAYGEIPDNTQLETKSSEDYISDYAYYQQQNEDVPSDELKNHYNEGIEAMFKGVNSLEALQMVVADMAEYGVDRQILGIGGFEETDEYKDFLSLLAEKINELFKVYNDSCKAVNDDCQKYQFGKTANNLLKMANMFGINDKVPEIFEFCDKEIIALVDSIYIEHRFIQLVPNKMHQLPYIVYNLKRDTLDEKILWRSEKPSVAQVGINGLVTAISPGYTRIIGRWCDIEDYIIVKVVEVDCKNEFCIHEECANGVYSGRGRLEFEDHEILDQNQRHIYFSWNVSFSIELNKSSRKYATTYSCYSFVKWIKYPEMKWHYSSDYSAPSTRSGLLRCSDLGYFYGPINDQIYIRNIWDFGSDIMINFGMYTVYGDYWSVATCSRIGL